MNAIDNRCIKCKKLCDTIFLGDYQIKDEKFSIKRLACSSCYYTFIRTMDGKPIKIKFYTRIKNNYYQIEYLFPINENLENFSIALNGVHGRIFHITDSFDFLNPHSWLILQAQRILDLQVFS